jgi:hypothetical protein
VPSPRLCDPSLSFSHGWRVLRFHSEAGSELSKEITGTIPTEIGNFHNVLTRIVVAGAPDLVGTVPTEIGRLTRLQEL